MTTHTQFFEEKNILVIKREKNIWNNTYKGIVYLDRDGVIIEDYGYVGEKERVDLIKGAQKAIKEVISRGFLVVVITNQSGIGRGYYSWKDYIEVTDRMIELLGKEAEPSVIIASGVIPNTGCESEHYRKPNIGMINYIRKEVLKKKYEYELLVGDKLSDIECGVNADIRQNVHLLTGHGLEERSAVKKFMCINKRKCIKLAKSLPDIIDLMP